jgi:hypothetical protein
MPTGLGGNARILASGGLYDAGRRARSGASVRGGFRGTSASGSRGRRRSEPGPDMRGHVAAGLESAARRTAADGPVPRPSRGRHEPPARARPVLETHCESATQACRAGPPSGHAARPEAAAAPPSDARAACDRARAKASASDRNTKCLG